MRKNNLYLISASAAMLLILMGTAVAETYDVQNVQFGQNELGYYKLIELNGNRQMVGYGTDLDKSVVDAANIGNAIFDIDLLKNGYASEVLIDAGDKYIVATGEELELNEGYVVAVQQVDSDGNKALIELIKDGKVVDTDVLHLEDSGGVYAYSVQDFGGYDNVPTIIVRMANVHRGTDTNVVTFDGIFQISESLTSVGVPVSIAADETYQETNAPMPNSKPNQEENPNDTDFIKFGIFFIVAIIILLRVLVGKMQSTNEQNKTITSSSISGKSSTVPIITTASGDSCESKTSSPNLQLASVESRFISRISDAFVILVMGVIIDVVLGGILYRDELNFMHILFAGVYYTYYFGQGQTLGMKMMDIKLCRTDGSYQIGYGQGLLRWIGTYISLFAIGLGYLWILIDENKQGWHDKIAGTYVVQVSKGTSLSTLGRGGAIKCVDRSIGINPQEAEAWRLKGLSHSTLGRHEEAIKCFDKSIGINPNNYEAWGLKGLSFSHLGRHEGAIRCFDNVIKINPQFEDAWRDKATSLSTLGRENEAIECFDMVLQINPQNGMAWQGKGVSLSRLGRGGEAIRYFNNAIEINPQNGMAWQEKGAAFSLLGKEEEAMECYNRALEINTSAKGNK